ncbi:hypothetical protein GGQ88_000653 [Novosphingobium hassiacum]|uniref:DUF4214 domain-containing protein n=1 Tax=Novosphingobium hassiacum TaxID=173676 RepID=A0A7W6EUM4_9SPHN|nr:DUF4214 domain-containing protein [Novosphingobium hassiacum]MBB3859413.1 hypothetical protein [Novosphingobium hassiacum]
MSEDDQKPVDALSISQLGRAFDQRLREETGFLEQEIARQATDAAGVVRKIEILFELAEQKIGRFTGALSATEIERERIAEELRKGREALEVQHTEKARAFARLERYEEEIARLCGVNAELERALADAVAKADVAVARYAEATKELAALKASFDVAQEYAGAATERADSFVRNARAREAMLQDEVAKVRLEEGIKAMRETVRAEYLAAQLSLTAQRTPGFSGIPELTSTNCPSSADRDAVGPAVVWLAENAEKFVGTAPDTGFEALAGQALCDPIFIAASYMWILGRPADDGGVAHYTGKLADGLTRAKLLENLVSSGEGRSRIALFCDALGRDDDAAIAAAYKLILGRSVDAAGAEHYRRILAKRNGRRMLVSDLASSREGRLSGTPLAAAIRIHSKFSLPSVLTKRKLAGMFSAQSGQTLQAWQAGRLGMLAREAAQRARELDARLNLLEADARRRPTRSDHALNAPTVRAFEHGVGRLVNVKPAVTSPCLDMLLGDSAHDRTPASIRSAIRSELGELEARP